MDNKEAVKAVWRAGAAFVITIALGFAFAGMIFNYGI